MFVFAQLLLSEEKDKERPANVEDDEDGHLIYNINDVIRKRCECFWILIFVLLITGSYNWIILFSCYCGALIAARSS